jgi:hypothetical protein
VRGRLLEYGLPLLAAEGCVAELAVAVVVLGEPCEEGGLEGHHHFGPGVMPQLLQK